MKLSVAIITFNEAYILQRNLKMVHDIADEIIIVDSYSTDETETIAKQFPKVQFFQKKFEGFGSQKNFALDKCTSKWILFVDADEIIDAECKKSIQYIINEPNAPYKVYKISFNNIVFDKVLNHSGLGGMKKIRFFKKDSGRFTEDIVHEHIITTENIGLLAGKINHYSIRSITYHIEKLNSYAGKMAQLRFNKGKRASIFSIFLSPFFRFLMIYIVKLGFLDGLAGLYMAVSESFYTYLKYMKLYELNRQKSK